MPTTKKNSTRSTSSTITRTRSIVGICRPPRTPTRKTTRCAATWCAIELQLDDDGKIKDCYFTGQGCVISQASASMLLEKMHGKTVDDVKQFSAEDMLKLYGARLTPNRQKCCLLSWKVLQSAVHSPVGRR